MYKLKGKKPELSYNLIIKYDSAGQLAVLESVWGEASSKSYCNNQNDGYFGLSIMGDDVLVWPRYNEDSDTVLKFLEVFEEVNNILPYPAQAVYDMGGEAREERKKKLKNEEKEAIDLFFSKVIIPRTEAGYTSARFTWEDLPGMGLEGVFRNFTKREFREVIEGGGFTVEWSGYHNANLNTHIDNAVVRISWDKG